MKAKVLNLPPYLIDSYSWSVAGCSYSFTICVIPTLKPIKPRTNPTHILQRYWGHGSASDCFPLSSFWHCWLDARNICTSPFDSTMDHGSRNYIFICNYLVICLACWSSDCVPPLTLDLFGHQWCHEKSISVITFHCAGCLVCPLFHCQNPINEGCVGKSPNPFCWWPLSFGCQ